MIAVLKFKLPDESHEFEAALEGMGHRTRSALEDIREEVFRPYRKHGYTDQRIQRALEDGHTHILMELLENKFSEILSNYDVKDI